MKFERCVLLKGLTEFRELLFCKSCIDNIEKSQRYRHDPRQNIHFVRYHRERALPSQIVRQSLPREQKLLIIVPKPADILRRLTLAESLFHSFEQRLERLGQTLAALRKHFTRIAIRQPTQVSGELGRGLAQGLQFGGIRFTLARNLNDVRGSLFLADIA